MPRARLVPLLAVAGVAVCAVVLVVILGVGTKDEELGAVEPLKSPYEVPRESHAAGDGLAHMRVALDQLSVLLLDPASTNDWINTWMAAVKLGYIFPPPPPGTPLYAPRSGTPEHDSRPVLEPDLAAHAEKHGWPDEYLDEVREYRRAVERLYIKALTLRKIDQETNTNTRDAVNIRAARLIGETGNPDLSDDAIEAMEKTFLKARYEVPQRLYDEAFGALGRLGKQEALEWMIDEFTYTKRSPPSYVDQLNAAHKTMILFARGGVSGKLRHEVVERMVMLYAGTEAVAAQDSDDGDVQAYKAYWNRIGPDAIKVVQYFAFDPKGEDGKPLDKMEEFQDWFRDHKDPSKPPWTDD